MNSSMPLSLSYPNNSKRDVIVLYLLLLTLIITLVTSWLRKLVNNIDLISTTRDCFDLLPKCILIPHVVHYNYI